MSERDIREKLQSIEQNLKDLNYVAQQISSEYTNKNKILEGGMAECNRCKALGETRAKALADK